MPGMARPRLEIEYCTQCRWLLRAGWMAQELLTTFPADLGEVAAVPGDSKGGSEAVARTIRTTAGAALLTAFAAALPALASAASLTIRATSNGLPVSVAVSATGRAGQAIATSDASGSASLSLPD